MPLPPNATYTGTFEASFSSIEDFMAFIGPRLGDLLLMNDDVELVVRGDAVYLKVTNREYGIRSLASEVLEGITYR